MGDAHPQGCTESPATFRSIRIGYVPVACPIGPSTNPSSPPSPGASEAERFRHSLGQIILGHRGVDLDDGQFETQGFGADRLPVPSRSHPSTPPRRAPRYATTWSAAGFGLVRPRSRYESCLPLTAAMGRTVTDTTNRRTRYGREAREQLGPPLAA